MSDGEETSRVSIPDNVQSTIQNIREITKKQHSDDEIYAVLKECSMDPNETAQKLLYLDTFHEVKSRRDRRKENVKGKASEDLRPAPGAHRRMVRGGGQGTYSSDAGRVRNSFTRRETGAGCFADGGSLSSSVPVHQKMINNAAAPIPKVSSVIPNGIKKLPNGTPSHVDAPKPSMAVDAPKSSTVVEAPKSSTVVEAPKSSTTVDANKLGAAAPRYAIVLASKPVIGLKDQRKTPAIVNQLPTSATSASDSGVHVPASDSSLSTQVQENKDTSDDSVNMELSKSEKVYTRSANHVIKEKTQSHTAKVAGKSQSTKSSQPPASSTTIVPSQSNRQSQQVSSDALKVVTPEVDITVEATSQVPHGSTLSDVKHVTFPNHIKVPESLRNALTFGSINATFGASATCVNSTGSTDSTGNAEPSQDNDEAASEPSLSNNNLAASVQGDLSEKSLSLPNVLEKLQPPEGNVSSTTHSDSKSELLKQDLQLFPEVPHNLPTLNGPSYNLDFLPPMLGNQVLHVEGHDNQANDAPRVSNFGENSTGVPSPNTTPPLPNSVAASPQSIPVFRHPYPANYFPYGYISPYYMPMHQFYPNGFPPQLVPPSTPTTGDIKYPPLQFKSGSNPGSAPQYNIQSVGYAPGPAISGNSAAKNEDHEASQVKESHIYTTGQLTQGSTVWYHTPGQDISSLYNLPQGQRYAFSPVHAGHGAMTGMYPPGQTMASPTYLQQSQAVAGATETLGPPPTTYQQPQHAQMSWSSSF